MELSRIKQHTPGTIANTWYEDGTVADPGSVTIRIARADGTELVAAGTPANGTGAAARTFDLTTAHTALLDSLTVTWTSASLGSDTSVVEVVGGFLFTIAEAKTIPGLSGTAAASIVKARTHAEQILERHLNDAFVPRYRRERITTTGDWSLLPSMPRLRAVRSITVNGVDLSAGELDALTVGAVVITGRRWHGDIMLAYEHGWDAPEQPIREAALAIAHYQLTSGIGQEGINPRVDYITTPEGRINYGRGPLGLPEVERASQLYDMNVGVA